MGILIAVLLPLIRSGGENFKLPSTVFAKADIPGIHLGLKYIYCSTDCEIIKTTRGSGCIFKILTLVNVAKGTDFQTRDLIGQAG